MHAVLELLVRVQRSNKLFYSLFTKYPLPAVVYSDYDQIEVFVQNI